MEDLLIHAHKPYLWFDNQSKRKKNYNSNQIYSAKKLTKCHILPEMMRPQYWKFRKYGVPHHCHYSHVHSDPK